MFDYAPPIGDAIINNRPGLLLIVEKQPWANTLDVTRLVEKAMSDLKPAMGEVEYDTTIFRPATFIERSLENLGHSMLVGCVFGSRGSGLVFVRLAMRCDQCNSHSTITNRGHAGVVLSRRDDQHDGTSWSVIALGEVVDDAIIDVRTSCAGCD